MWNESLLHLVLEYNSEYAYNLWPHTFLCVIFLIVGLLGNGFVLFVYTFRMDEKTESRFFIPYLAVADAFASVSSCVYFTFDNMHILYFPWDGLCRTLLFLPDIPTLASVFILLAIAVQRYTMTKPLGKQFSLVWRKRALIFISFVAFALSIGIPIVSGSVEVTGPYKGFNLTGYTCRTGSGRYPVFEQIYYGFLALVLVVNIVVTCVLYIPIAVTIYKKQKSKKWTPESPSSSSQIQDTNEKGSGKKSKSSSPSTNFNVMFMTIVGVYVLSFLPTSVLMIITKSQPEIWEDIPAWKLVIYAILIRSYVINNIANPVIYGYFDMKFRKYLKKSLCICQSD